jgi:hypothetical protein
VGEITSREDNDIKTCEALIDEIAGDEEGDEHEDARAKGS